MILGLAEYSLLLANLGVFAVNSFVRSLAILQSLPIGAFGLLRVGELAAAVLVVLMVGFLFDRQCHRLGVKPVTLAVFIRALRF